MTMEGLVALVTGSSRNLGAATARELAKRGASVIVTHRSSPKEAAALVAELSRTGHQSHQSVSADFSSLEGVARFTDRLTTDGSPVDILVNNVGPFAMDPLTELSEAEWDRIWIGNLETARLCSRAVATGMRSLGRGRIVNVSAGSAYIRNHSIYTLVKAALVTLTEALALELGPEINVNAVAPGQIAESADDISAFDPDFVARAIEHTPLARLVHRDEVASIIADLCEPRFDGVTGVTIPIDGGWRLNRFQR